MEISAESPFPQRLLDSLRDNQDTPAFEFRSHEISRGEVLALIGRCAAGLRAAGLGRGSSVAVTTAVTPEGFAAQIAAHVLGCRVTGLRPGLPLGQLAHVLSLGVDAVLADESTALPDLLAAAGGTPVLRLRTDLLDPHPEPAGLTVRGRPDDIALVNLTSGSTAAPKGCAQTYRSLTAHWSWQPARWTEETSRLAAGYRRYLLFGTLTSAVIFENLGLCLIGGGTAVIPDLPLEFPQVFERYGITACLMTVPRLYQVLDVLRSTDIDVSTLRALTVAGSPLAPHRLAEARDRLGPVVYQAYGQTETGVLTRLAPDDKALDSVGRPCDGVRIEIRDDDNRPLPVGRTGEIWARTDYAMAGYWQDEDQTRDVLRDGWVRTQDLGHLDRDGYLHLTGRARDVIIVNAIVHYAGPIERALAAHPDVDQAYVVGAPDDHTGEAAHAFVVPRTLGHIPDPDALRARVAAVLGAAAVPATITVIHSVPTAPGGKPDKRALIPHAR
ncbi:class I adenylate-forming enzyme family protein [Actinacidiphila oryziradicis]|uniref:Long-chain fatty acid--CoA ligase n=1 Tax=Actinacidiphila oryziradicis TaxID=2571141 RepID=A0A4U0SR52_9ACTN|nr:fatty acid--CoA ligase family protein [Actinacidiphila oryziradicis]TKA11878.1 long-chain fatty acid--CoA ligase [Actinacidiphila oryziradicis]